MSKIEDEERRLQEFLDQRPRGQGGRLDEEELRLREFLGRQGQGAPAEATGRALPKKPLHPRYATDPQRKAEGLWEWLSVVPSIQVGWLDALRQRRSPFKTIPEAVFTHRMWGDVAREVLPKVSVPPELALALAPQSMVSPFGVGATPAAGVPPKELGEQVSETLSRAIPFGAGLAADIAWDPSSYLGFGGLTKLGQARKFATLGRMTAELGSAGGDVARAQAAVKKAGGELAPTWREQAIRDERAFMSFAGRPVIKGAPALGAAEAVIEKAKDLTPFARVAPKLKGLEREAFLAREAEVASAPRRGAKRGIAALEPVGREVRALSKKHKIDQDALHAAISEAVERSRPPDGATAIQRGRLIAKQVELQLQAFGGPAARELAKPARRSVWRINALNADNLARAQAEGIDVARLMADEEYLKHMTTPEARKILNDRYPGGFKAFARKYTERHGAQQQRGLPGSLVEINKQWQAGKLALTGFKPTKTNLFEPDPFLATVRATAENEYAVEAARLLKDYARTVGKPAGSPGTQGWMKVGSDLPALKDVVFPPNVAVTLSKHFDPATREVSARGWKALNRAWARSVTMPFPGFHVRNEFGDIWNIVGLGGANPKWFDEAVPMLLGQNMDQTIRVGPYTLTRAQAWDLMERLNVMNSGQIAVFRSGIGTLSNPRGLPQRLDQNAAMRFAQSVAEARENSTRIMGWLDGMAKGMEPAVAAERVRTYVFDYGRLPRAVEVARDNAMPFLAWTYYNAPLQMSNFIQKPGRFAAVQKLREEAREGEPMGFEEGQLPRFISRRMPISVGRSPEKHRQFMALEGYWPGTDLELMNPLQWAERAEDLLTPLLTAPIESYKNWDAFRGRPLALARAEALKAGHPEWSPLWGWTETQPFLGARVPSRAMPFVESVRALTELNRLLGLGQGPVPSAGTRAMQALTGARIYPVDEASELEHQAKLGQLGVGGLERLYRIYERRGDTANMENVARMIVRARSGGF